MCWLTNQNCNSRRDGQMSIVTKSAVAEELQILTCHYREDSFVRVILQCSISRAAFACHFDVYPSIDERIDNSAALSFDHEQDIAFYTVKIITISDKTD